MRIVCISNHINRTMLMSTEDVLISLVDTLGVCVYMLFSLWGEYNKDVFKQPPIHVISMQSEHSASGGSQVNHDIGLTTCDVTTPSISRYIICCSENKDHITWWIDEFMSSPENSSHGLQSTLIHLCITGTTSLFASFTMHVHVANNYNLNILLCTKYPNGMKWMLGLWCAPCSCAVRGYWWLR